MIIVEPLNEIERAVFSEMLEVMQKALNSLLKATGTENDERRKVRHSVLKGALTAVCSYRHAAADLTSLDDELEWMIYEMQCAVARAWVTPLIELDRSLGDEKAK